MSSLPHRALLTSGGGRSRLLQAGVGAGAAVGGWGVARQKGQAKEAQGAAGIMDSSEGWDRRSVCKVHLLLGVNDPSLLPPFPPPGPCSCKIPQSWTGR